MNHYVYCTSMSKFCTAHARWSHEAWAKASKRHKVRCLFSLSGEAWVASVTGNPIRDSGADITPERAAELYVDTCMVELARDRADIMHGARSGFFTTALIRRLRKHGLYVFAEGLTELGNLFVAKAGTGT